MHRPVLKGRVVCFALAFGVCLAPSADAQVAQIGGLMKPAADAGISWFIPETKHGALANRNADSALVPEAAGAVDASRSEKKKRDIQLTITMRDPQIGISGFVEDSLTGARLNFESKRVGEQLSSRIMNKDGFTIIDYVEALTPVPHSEPGSPATIELVPWLRVNGVEHKGYEGQIVDEMKFVASSNEGELIRHLAIYIIFHAPGDDLSAERRGLEVPYQALQQFYDRSFKKMGSDSHDRAELEAAGRVGQTPEGGLYTHRSEAPPPDFLLMPAGCKMPQCDYVDTHDYQLTEKGGFVVKNLSQRLPLSHNYGQPLRANSVDVEQIRPMDDGSQVGDCFGRCYAGCGDWTHEWISRTDYDEYYCAQVNVPPDMPMPDCSWMCCVEERRYVGSQGIAVHTAHGKVTPGSIAHDWCCRNLFFGCWNPVCIALLPGALDCLIPGVGWDETWSYVGPHSEIADYATGVCCY